MLKKSIFNKKKNNSKILLSTFFIFIVIYLFIYLYMNSQKKIFIISPNIESSYYIPKIKGGQKIPNQNKKGLHLTYTFEDGIDINNYTNFNFSIQILTNQNYNIVNEKRISLLENKKLIIQPEHLLIVMFDNSLGKEYFLLYKNFKTRLNAENYCDKYVFFLDKCLVVNVQNLD